MKSALALAVIIAGVVLFSFEDRGALSAAAVDIQNWGDARDARRDVYGNEITPAVADYLIDPYGDMYERHAPDSALLELGQPES